MMLKKEIKLDELLFSIGIYPDLQAIDKFYLCTELLKEYFSDVDIGFLTDFKALKKLSPEKKASFLAFYEQLDIKEQMDQYQLKGIQWTHLLSTKYPDRLKTIYAPPIVLFYKGNIEQLNQKTWLGVVGSRDFTSYGKQAVEYILETLFEKSKGQIGIVSGLAKGIDTEAHIVTIKNNESTVGVIGTGLEQYYPKANQSLQQLMSDKHLVLSEYPIGAKPLKFHFPERNRIIAGLSRGILVIESKKRSGSLITAYNALDESRDVFAVPGSIFEEPRMGNHRLIQLGAILTQSGEDILREWFII